MPQAHSARRCGSGVRQTEMRERGAEENRVDFSSGCDISIYAIAPRPNCGHRSNGNKHVFGATISQSSDASVTPFRPIKNALRDFRAAVASRIATIK